jgi:hypothetical protein
LFQSNPADQPQPVCSSLGLSFPSALAGIEGPLCVGVPHPLPFRLQGLATLLAVCSLRSLADPVSDRQRSWDSPFGAFLPPVCSAVSIRTDPPTISPALVPDVPVGPVWQAAGPGFSGRRKFLSASVVLVRLLEVTPWVFPFQGFGQDLDRDFARSPLTRFPGRL